jgi:hypothetical protein
MLQSGYTQKSIAIALNKNKSVISREISRNRDKRTRTYIAPLAQRKCDERHKSKKKHIKLTNEMRLFIVEKLKGKYSPEQIVGWSKRHAIECVSHQWIYKMVWDDKKRRGNNSYYVNIVDNFIANSDWLTQEEADYLTNLFYSPNVYIQVGTEMLPVIITDSQFNTKTNPRTQKNFQYVINYQLANNKRAR